MVKLTKYFPKTDNILIEGGRLALFNMGMLTVGGIFSYALLWLVDRIRSFGIPIPLPVWLLMLLIGIPYFVIWFQYGRVFGLRLKRPNFFKGLTMGLIGQMPGFLLYYLIVKLKFEGAVGEIIKIISIILRTFILVAPIMATLGSLDIKKDG